MTALASDTGRAVRDRNPQRSRLVVVGVIGELLITAGVVVMLFLVWYLWLGDRIAGSAQNDAAVELQQEWVEQSQPDNGAPVESAAARVVRPLDPSLAPVLAEPTATAERFATIIVPRFGEDWVRTIAQGVEPSSVLNDPETGVGHYPGTAMPGAVGNFAIAAHRTTYGAPFRQLVDLKVGDSIYIETAEGWYHYAYRNLEYVRPTAVDVLQPVPREPGMEANERILTMTTCNPLFSAAERAIGYSVMTGWFPRGRGTPPELADPIAAVG